MFFISYATGFWSAAQKGGTNGERQSFCASNLEYLKGGEWVPEAPDPKTRFPNRAHVPSGRFVPVRNHNAPRGTYPSQ